ILLLLSVTPEVARPSTECSRRSPRPGFRPGRQPLFPDGFTRAGSQLVRQCHMAVPQAREQLVATPLTSLVMQSLVKRRAGGRIARSVLVRDGASKVAKLRRVVRRWRRQLPRQLVESDPALPGIEQRTSRGYSAR